MSNFESKASREKDDALSDLHPLRMNFSGPANLEGMRKNEDFKSHDGQLDYDPNAI